MAIKTVHDTTEKTWFITFTCYGWLPLFETTKSYDLVYNWLRLINQKLDVKTVAFVIMPNHIHLILHLSEGKNLNTIISNGKRFMAYEIVKRLSQNGKLEILKRLNEACSDKEKAKGQKHKVFEPSFDAKALFTNKFMHQKINYIHHNPVSGIWKLVESFPEYPHSSAMFYENDLKHLNIDICHYLDIEG
ncbi:transposase [Pedobacter sp. SD-b]|uniref:Transposase n=1 Tax=Pedobacter segetis TaxID=2793069 RepID=A0ABS1BLG1_9SPHI|nr:transposase [Pedobacter segetis]MBK0383735.1 transposase [Pedobacter segetis]